MQDRQLLPALDGWVVGVDLGELLSEKLGLLLLPGLEIAGESALRKSVYAVGGVIGVLVASSCFITSSNPSAGLLGSSEGSGADLGVLSAGSSGFGERGVRMVGRDDSEAVDFRGDGLDWAKTGGEGSVEVGSGEPEGMIVERSPSMYYEYIEK